MVPIIMVIQDKYLISAPENLSPKTTTKRARGRGIQPGSVKCLPFLDVFGIRSFRAGIRFDNYNKGMDAKKPSGFVFRPLAI